VRTGLTTGNLSVLLMLLGFFLLVLDTLVTAGVISMSASWLLPGGLASWCLAALLG
jgi:uncharacterized membrane protein (Fun14 family)